MRQKMSKGECNQHDGAWEFDFGTPGMVNLVPPEYIGQAQPKKKLFGLLGSSPSIPQDYAKVAKTEHPMSVNMRDSLAEQIASSPDLLQHCEKSFSFLHDLSLAGSFDGVDVLVTHGADVSAKATNGMTAIDLAKLFGWRRVLQRLQST